MFSVQCVSALLIKATFANAEGPGEVALDAQKTINLLTATKMRSLVDSHTSLSLGSNRSNLEVKSGATSSLLIFPQGRMEKNTVWSQTFSTPMGFSPLNRSVDDGRVSVTVQCETYQVAPMTTFVTSAMPSTLHVAAPHDDDELPLVIAVVPLQYRKPLGYVSSSVRYVSTQKVSPPKSLTSPEATPRMHFFLREILRYLDSESNLAVALPLFVHRYALRTLSLMSLTGIDKTFARAVYEGMVALHRGQDIHLSVGLVVNDRYTSNAYL